MVGIVKVDNSACRFLSNPMFASVGDVKQASEMYRSNRYDPTANDILQSYREFRVCCIETSLGMLEQGNTSNF